MQGVHLREYGVAATIDFALYEVDGVDLRTDWTPAAGDVFMMRDEAAEEQLTNASGTADLSTLVTDEGRGYSITLALEDMQAARILIYLIDQATKVFLDWPIVVETYGHASAQHLNFPSDLTHIMGTILTEGGSGRLAAALIKFLDVATPAKDINDIGAPASGAGSPLVLGAGDVGDFEKDGVVHFFWNTIDRSGAAVAPSTAGTLRIYVDDGTSEITAPTGIEDNRAFDGVTGLQECKVDLSASTSYVKEKNYSVILVGAVVDTKTVNPKVGSFSIENRWANVHFEYGG